MVPVYTKNTGPWAKTGEKKVGPVKILRISQSAKNEISFKLVKDEPLWQSR